MAGPAVRFPMDGEEPEDEGVPDAEPEPAAPTKPELRIRDLGERRGCSVCGKEKPPHIEILVDGAFEYTCRECYEGQVIELAACRTCGAALEAVDEFCGKCGTPRVLKCASCGTEAGPEDRFCGKCGAKVT